MLSQIKNTIYRQAEGFGNRKFYGIKRKIDNWNYPNAMLYWRSRQIAYECLKSKKRSKVRRRPLDRRLIDIWWTYYYLRGIKLNGFDLGVLYEKTNS